MKEPKHFPYGHLLPFLSPHNKTLVANYLTLLQARQYAPNTLAAIAGTLKSFCLLLPQPRRDCIIDDFAHTTADDIDAYMQAACELGRAPSTISGALVTIRCFFAFLLEEGHLQRQPVRRHRHQIIVPQTLPRPMPQDDVVKLFQVIDSLRDRVLFLLMLRCGLRVNEVRQVPWSAVNWEQSSVRIDDGKGQVDRVVYYSRDVEQALSQWHRWQPQGTRYLFPSRIAKRGGQPIARRTVADVMTKYLHRAGLERRYSCHSLRHTFASELLNAGASLEVVKELMGHKKLDMTLRYAKLYEATKRQQYDQAMAALEPHQNLLGATL